ncbi:MAG: putative Ig domain-containing protein [Nitrospirae bacterium]|nr:putative Ig domain-containing protein [Nitrospirota bacterium]
MLKRLLITIMILVSFVSAVYAAETDWSVHVKVSVPDSRGSDGTVWNHLIAGTMEGATDGFDSSWDTLSMAGADDPVQAMFTHGTLSEYRDKYGKLVNWTCSNPGEGYTDQECSLWRDIRPFGESKVWTFRIISTVNGGTVTLNWNFENKPAQMDILLVDLSNPANIIDMRSSSRYLYTNNIPVESGKKYGIRDFEIRMMAKGLFITPPYLPDGTMDNFYNEKLSAVGGTAVWRLSEGMLPPGMTLNPETGEITGAPSATGLYRFVIIGDDTVNGYSRSRDYTLNINSIPEIDAAMLPDGVAGEAYTGRISVTGGSKPIVWSIIGNLPEGVTLDSSTGVLSGDLIVPGIYEFVAGIRDVNGATASRRIRISVTEPDDSLPPDAIRDLQGFYVTDTSVLLMWSAPSDDGMSGTAALYDLRYLECSASSVLADGEWDRAIEVTGEQRPQKGVLQTYTMTGLEAGRTYCIAIKSVDSSGHVSPVSNIVMFPLSSQSYAAGTSGFVKLTSPLTLRKGYNLISLPLLPVPNDAVSLFAPSVGPDVALYRWYSAYPGLTPPQYYSEDSVSPGLGYFLYSPVDGINLFIDGVRIESPEYGMELQTGWNMVGTPYEHRILMKDVVVRDHSTGEEKPFTEAIKNGLAGNTLYYLKDGNYDFTSFNDDPPAAFEPWTGYWLYVNGGDGLEIVFRRPE